MHVCEYALMCLYVFKGTWGGPKRAWDGIPWSWSTGQVGMCSMSALLLGCRIQTPVLVIMQQALLALSHFSSPLKIVFNVNMFFFFSPKTDTLLGKRPEEGLHFRQIYKPWLWLTIQTPEEESFLLSEETFMNTCIYMTIFWLCMFCYLTY